MNAEQPLTLTAKNGSLIQPENPAEVKLVQKSLSSPGNSIPSLLSKSELIVSSSSFSSHNDTNTNSGCSAKQGPPDPIHSKPKQPNMNQPNQDRPSPRLPNASSRFGKKHRLPTWLGGHPITEDDNSSSVASPNQILVEPSNKHTSSPSTSPTTDSLNEMSSDELDFAFGILLVCTLDNM